MKCPYKNIDCQFVDTAGMTKTKECNECEHYISDDTINKWKSAFKDYLEYKNVQLANPKTAFLGATALLLAAHGAKEPDQDNVRATGAMPVLSMLVDAIKARKEQFTAWKKSLKTKYQVVHWEENHGLRFIKGNALKDPAAFHLIYKWSFCIGKTEIRKFLNDKELYRAIQTYINKPL